LDYLKEIEKVPVTGVKVVLDLANGAAYSIAPKLIASLGANVKLISDKPDGANINDNCGSTHIENLQRVMQSQTADVGFAFDGDGDRILAVDENANIVDGDQIILIAALELAQQRRLHNNIVVTTVLSNYGLEEALQRHNITLKRTQVGDRYVVEEMVRSGATLGGEQSGHVVFLDYNTAGDGLITAVKLLAILKKSGRKLSSLASEMVRYPQVHLNVKVRNTSDWEGNYAIQEAISNAKQEIRGQGRVVVRASGTEPLIRIMVEGKDDSVIRRMAEELAEVVRTAIGFQ
jgi:phosphoglucosamine mutase